MSFESIKEHYRLESYSHSGRTLWTHLNGVYDILCSWNVEDAVCVAGLFHSIYGTEIYQHQAAQLIDRQKLASLIGNRAERLSYLFSAIDRKSVWPNVIRNPSEYKVLDRFTKKIISISQQEMQDYFTIFLANLIEQRPHLQTAKNAYVSDMLMAHSLFHPLIWLQFLKAYALD